MLEELCANQDPRDICMTHPFKATVLYSLLIVYSICTSLPGSAFFRLLYSLPGICTNQGYQDTNFAERHL